MDRSARYSVILSYLLGVALWPYVESMGWFLFSLLIVAVVMVGFVQKYLPNKAIVLVALLLFSIGVFHRQYIENRYDTARQEVLSLQEVVVRARVVRPPKEGSFTTALVVRPRYIEENEIYGHYAIQLRTRQKQEFQYGDEIQFRSQILLPASFVTDSGRTFEYKQYLRASNIIGVAESNNVEVLSREEERSLVGFLLQVRNTALARVERSFHAPASGLVAGVLLGEEVGMGDWEDIFRKVGLTHIVVLSGSNMAIVAIVIRVLLGWFIGRYALWASLVGTVLFAILVGGGPTVVRATIMVVLALLALWFGRTADGIWSLAFAVMIMVIARPTILLWDVGFQLSLGATFGLLLLTQPLTKVFVRIPSWGGIREIVATTIATQIAVLPLLVFALGEVSLVSVVANSVVVPVVPFVMLGGFLVILFTGIPLLAGIVSVGTSVLVEGIFKVTQLLSMIPFASVRVPAIGVVGLVVLYGLIFFVMKKVCVWADKRTIVFGHLVLREEVID